VINAYRIGVHMVMTQNVTHGIAGIIAKLASLDQAMVNSMGKIRGLGVAIAGVGMAFAGTEILRGVGVAVKAAEELVHEQVKLRMAGEDSAAVAKATGKAWEVAFSAPGTGVAQNMRVLGDLRGLFGSLKEGEQVLPRFAEFQQVLAGVTGKSDEKAGGIMAQALDLMGAVRFDPNTGELIADRFSEYMNQAMAAVINNRGRVGPEQILNFVKRGGTAAKAMNPQQLFADMSVLIESMGGENAGTAVTAMQRQFLSGIMTDRNFDLMRMIDMTEGPAGKIKPKERAAAAAAMQREMEGGATINPASLVKVAPRGIKGSDRLARGDYSGFVIDVLVPQIKKFLEKSGQEVNDTNILALLTRVGSTAPGQRGAAELYLSQQQRDRERRMQGDIAKDPNKAVQTLRETDPEFARNRLQNAWKNLQASIGVQGIPLFVKSLNLLSDGLDRLTKVVNENPEAARNLLNIAAGLGVALVVIGGLAVVVAAVGAITGLGLGPVTLAILALGGALGYLAKDVDWGRLTSDLKTKFTEFWTYIKSLSAQARDILVPAGERVALWAEQTFSRIKLGFVNAFEALKTRAGEAWSSLYRGITDWAQNMVQAGTVFLAQAGAVIQSIIDWITGLPGRILGAVTGTTAATSAAASAAGAGVTPGAAVSNPAAAPVGATGGAGEAVPAPAAPITPGVSPSAFVPSGTERGVPLRTALYLDSRLLTEVVTRNQGRALNAAPQGASFGDRRRGVMAGDVVTA
jgi:hypothetical protein